MKNINYSVITNVLKIVILLLGLSFIVSILFVNYLPLDPLINLFNNDSITYILKAFEATEKNGLFFYAQIEFSILYLCCLIVCIIFLPGRKFVEILILFFGFFIPNHRKYWGTIINENNDKPIPFATIYLKDKSADGTVKILKQAIADLDGRYRIDIDKADYSNLMLEVKATGFDDFEKNIRLNTLFKTNYLTIADTIPMVEVTKKESKISDFLFNIDSNDYLIYFIYILSVAALVSSILLIGTVPKFLSAFQLIFYGTSVVWNTYILISRSRTIVGRVINIEDKQPIQDALVNVYDLDGKELGSFVTDNEGLIESSLGEGNYEVTVSKPGYTIYGASNDPALRKRVHIDSRGYFSSNILLYKLDPNAVNSRATDLPNPFV